MGYTPNLKRINTIEDLYELAGGCATLAAQLGVHQCSVEYWRRAGGPPIRYWEKLFDLYGVTPAEMYHICRKCLAIKTRVKK